jgi:hypothetical protein
MEENVKIDLTNPKFYPLIEAVENAVSESFKYKVISVKIKKDRVIAQVLIEDVSSAELYNYDKEYSSIETEYPSHLNIEFILKHKHEKYHGKKRQKRI